MGVAQATGCGGDPGRRRFDYSEQVWYRYVTHSRRAWAPVAVIFSCPADIAVAPIHSFDRSGFLPGWGTWAPSSSETGLSKLNMYAMTNGFRSFFLIPFTMLGRSMAIWRINLSHQRYQMRHLSLNGNTFVNWKPISYLVLGSENMKQKKKSVEDQFTDDYVLQTNLTFSVSISKSENALLFRSCSFA